MSLSKMGDAISTLRKHGHSMSSGGMCESCGGACKYSSGGEVKGVNKPIKVKDHKAQKHMGMSEAGNELRLSNIDKAQGHPYSAKIGKEDAKEKHREVLSEMKSMPNPKLKGLAHGGEVKNSDMDMKESKAFEEKGDVGDSDHDGDEMLHSVMGEFHESLKSGDHKGAVESLRALIHSIKGES